jgi:Kef-type K+ transport system membrane component KefB
MFDSNLGRRVLGYAVVNDVSLWIILAIITSYSSALGNSNHILAHAGLTIGLTALFFYVMIVGVRTALNWLAHRGFLTKEASGAQLGFIVAGILLSGLITELIGIHYLFGTFVFGAMIPKDISHSLYKAFEKFTMIVLMPFFFILTGLKTTLSFSNNSIWIFFAAATLVAILGKILGTAIPERIFYKSSIPSALKSGVLMQTKGLMEVVVLNILLSAHLINSAVFSALVLMAVTTTLLTKPSLHLIDALSAPVRKLVATYS